MIDASNQKSVLDHNNNRPFLVTAVTFRDRGEKRRRMALFFGAVTKELFQEKFPYADLHTVRVGDEMSFHTDPRDEAFVTNLDQTLETLE